MAYLSLGDVYFNTGQYAQAVAAYDRGLALDPADRLLKRPRRDLAFACQDQPGTERDAATIQAALGGKLQSQMGPVGIRPDCRIDLQIPFAYDSDRLLPAAQQPLRTLGTALRAILDAPESADAAFLIEGHTDQRSTETYNRELSQRRARRVVEELVKVFRIPAERLALQGYGKSRPRSLGSSEADHARNRRVEVVWLEKPELLTLVDQHQITPAQLPTDRPVTTPLVIETAVFYEDAEARPRKLEAGGVLRFGDGYRIYLEPQQPCYWQGRRPLT